MGRLVVKSLQAKSIRQLGEMARQQAYRRAVNEGTIDTRGFLLNLAKLVKKMAPKRIFARSAFKLLKAKPKPQARSSRKTARLPRR